MSSCFITDINIEILTHTFIRQAREPPLFALKQLYLPERDVWRDRRRRTLCSLIFPRLSLESEGGGGLPPRWHPHWFLFYYLNKVLTISLLCSVAVGDVNRIKWKGSSTIKSSSAPWRRRWASVSSPIFRPTQIIFWAELNCLSHRETLFIPPLRATTFPMSVPNSKGAPGPRCSSAWFTRTPQAVKTWVQMMLRSGPPDI